MEENEYDGMKATGVFMPEELLEAGRILAVKKYKEHLYLERMMEIILAERKRDTIFRRIFF